MKDTSTWLCEMTHWVCLCRRAGRVPTPPPQALLSEALAAADLAGDDDMADELVAAPEVHMDQSCLSCRSMREARKRKSHIKAQVDWM